MATSIVYGFKDSQGVCLPRASGDLASVNEGVAAMAAAFAEIKLDPQYPPTAAVSGPNIIVFGRDLDGNRVYMGAGNSAAAIAVPADFSFLYSNTLRGFGSEDLGYGFCGYGGSNIHASGVFAWGDNNAKDSIPADFMRDGGTIRPGVGGLLGDYKYSGGKGWGNTIPEMNGDISFYAPYGIVTMSTQRDAIFATFSKSLVGANSLPAGYSVVDAVVIGDGLVIVAKTSSNARAIFTFGCSAAVSSVPASVASAVAANTGWTSMAEVGGSVAYADASGVYAWGESEDVNAGASSLESPGPRTFSHQFFGLKGHLFSAKSISGEYRNFWDGVGPDADFLSLVVDQLNAVSLTMPVQFTSFIRTGGGAATSYKIENTYEYVVTCIGDPDYPAHKDLLGGNVFHTDSMAEYYLLGVVTDGIEGAVKPPVNFNFWDDLLLCETDQANAILAKTFEKTFRSAVTGHPSQPARRTCPPPAPPIVPPPCVTLWYNWVYQWKSRYTGRIIYTIGGLYDKVALPPNANSYRLIGQIAFNGLEVPC